jgi:hypothetical protein
LGTRASHIGVNVEDGIVALTGLVDDSMEKRAAAGAVERVCGVRAIKNVIAVQLVPLHDEQHATARRFILETAQSTTRN